MKLISTSNCVNSACAVGPRVFIAEAADDLHVLVAAGHHQDLLEQLRALRQGVEAAAGISRLGTRKSRLPSGCSWSGTAFRFPRSPARRG